MLHIIHLVYYCTNTAFPQHAEHLLLLVWGFLLWVLVFFLRGMMWFIFLNGYASLLIFIEGMSTFSKKKKKKREGTKCYLVYN